MTTDHNSGEPTAGQSSVARSIEPGSANFPTGFFDRTDESADTRFYGPPRFVTHIDDAAIAAVGQLYADLGLDGRVLDVASSWVSHFTATPRALVGLGLNERELQANPQMAEWVVQDLNVDPVLPFDDASFDHATCCVSVDYLTRPLDVFAELARVLRPGGLFVVTFSNRCFPTKAIRGWLATGDAGRVAIVERYFAATTGFDPPDTQRRDDPAAGGDPLYAVRASRRRE